MRIIFLGDSLTQGTFGVSYVDKVAAALPDHQIINRGVNGDTSLNLCRRLDKDVIAAKPDGVAIMIGINDAISWADPGSRLFYRLWKGIPGGTISPAAFRENLGAILNKLMSASIQPWVILPPIEYNPAQVNALREMNGCAANVCSELNAPTLDLLTPLVMRPVRARPPVRITTYQRNLLVYLGLMSYDRLRDQGGFSYSFDGVHLTEAGAQQVATEVLAFLQAQGIS